jgi:glutaconyl-CoA/methylmalonyl-CoA decarboxylase subunit delta
MILEIGLSNIDFKSILVSTVGILVVFAALTLLVVVFTNIPRVSNLYRKIRSNGLSSLFAKPSGKTELNKNIVPDPRDLGGGDSAVIAAAVYLFLNEIHDDENRIVTIKRVSRTYSPWNSKIYGVNWLRGK